MDTTLITTFPGSVSVPAAIALIVGGSFALLVAWGTYSVRVQKSLKKGTFAVMELLSETRDTYGNPSRIPEIARRFRRASLTDLRRSFVRIGGDSFGESPSSRRGSVRVRGDVAVRYCSDEGKQAVYGRRAKTTDRSLRELVSEKTPMMEIEEDFFRRANWSERIDECVPIRDLPKNSTKTPEIGGARTFCYRDYVNHEELMGMMWKRGGIEGFLFKPSRADVITIDEDTKECALSASSKLFRIVPISIRWEGKLVDQGRTTIHWHTTSLTLGWESFGRFFDKPAAAEKLRKDPWHISVPPTDADGDILCFHREGKGHLVFAREECLAKGPKSQ